MMQYEGHTKDDFAIVYLGPYVMRNPDWSIVIVRDPAERGDRSLENTCLLAFI